MNETMALKYFNRKDPVGQTLLLNIKENYTITNAWLRNTLVVFQFTISIILIAGTLVINNQLAYIRNKDIGFNREQVLIIRNTSVLKEQAPVFRNELLNISGISHATMTGYLPVNGDRSNDAFFTSPAMDPKTSVLMQKWKVDENYIPAFGAHTRDWYPQSIGCIGRDYRWHVIQRFFKAGGYRIPGCYARFMVGDE